MKSGLDAVAQGWYFDSLSPSLTSPRIIPVGGEMFIDKSILIREERHRRDIGRV